MTSMFTPTMLHGAVLVLLSPLLLLSSAHPAATPETPQIRALNLSSSSEFSNVNDNRTALGLTLNFTAPPGSPGGDDDNANPNPIASTFEDYLATGFASFQAIGPDALLHFVLVHPWHKTWGGQAHAPTDFVRMSIEAKYPDSNYDYLVFNEEALTIPQLRQFSRPTRDSKWRQNRGFATMAFPQVRAGMHMDGAFRALSDAHRTSGGGGLGYDACFLGRFTKTPPGHQDEIFYAFYNSKGPQPQWTYVGTRSRDVIDDESPWVLAGDTNGADIGDGGPAFNNGSDVALPTS